MQRYGPATAGYEMHFPDDWLLIPHGLGGEILAYEQHERGEGFRANIFLSRRSGVTENLDDVDATSFQDLSDGLSDWRLLDLEHLGPTKLRLLGTYVQGIYQLTLEQWSSIHNGSLFTLSATCPSRLYPELAEEFREIESSLKAAS